MKWFGRKRRGNRIREYQRRFRWKFENLKNLLRLNSDLMETLSGLQTYTGGRIPEDAYTYHQISTLVDGVALMIENLNQLAGHRYTALFPAHRKLAGQIQQLLNQARGDIGQPPAVPLEAVDRSRISEVGGKAAHLGELSRVFPVNVPRGFVVTTAAYYRLLNENNLSGELRALHSRINPEDIDGAEVICRQIRRYLLNCIIPDAITEAIDRMLDAIPDGRNTRWAVRSSAVGEDGVFSFAGQFDSLLNIRPEELAGAYLKVIASRFNTSAVLYRLAKGIREAECPMAVLFIPMIEARASGVIYTRHPGKNADDRLLISSVNGLSAELVGGKINADYFYLDRSSLAVIEQEIGNKTSMLVASEEQGVRNESVPEERQKEPSLDADQAECLGRMALHVEEHFGTPKDIEWAIDREGKCWVLQARPLHAEQSGEVDLPEEIETTVLAEGGAAVFPGRAQGPLHALESEESLSEVEPGSILLVRQAVPRIVSVFPRLAGLIVETGHPTGHAATLAREYSLPTLFNLAGAFERLRTADQVGLDASRRRVYLGLPWPNLPKRELAAEGASRPKAGPFNELLFKLELSDPAAANFTPRGCRSLHDIIRFAHEKAITSLFDIGDSQVRHMKQGPRLLESDVPLQLTVLDIGGAVDERHARKTKVRPKEVRSVPFQALWRGVSNPEISWAGRSAVSLDGFGSVVMTSITGDAAAGRTLGDRNYLIVSPEYLNLNARLAYHFSLIDSLVCDRPVSNYVNFRFRGGGAARHRRGLRARFLTGVLLYAGFSVDRREDLLNAWFRGYDREACEARLETLGRLMGCARQLDMLLDSDQTVSYYIDQFQSGNYRAFH